MQRVEVGDPVGAEHHRFAIDPVRVGLNYHFDIGDPVVARY
jgi:hypothetical protein